MLKTILMAGAALIAAPVLAQENPAQTPGDTSIQQPVAPTELPQAPAPQTSAPDPMEAPLAPEAPVMPETATPAGSETAMPATPAAPATPETSVAGPTETEAAPSQAQVAEIVASEFPTYDKDSSSDLNKTEFGSWMTALSTASGQATAPSADWMNNAFAQADTDKSSSVSQAELTGFLSQGA